MRNSSCSVSAGPTVLRITRLEFEDNVTLVLEGKLHGAWLDELRAALVSVATGKHVILDLAALSFADSCGVRFLAALQRQGIVLYRPSALMSALILAAAV
jgi:ABC-type transporter Mla MlaB component